jgi:hypothetical protein
MKRNTDVSRLQPAEIQDAAETGARPSSCAAAVDLAAALLVHGMHNSEAPINELSDALARMARTLADIGAPLFGAPDVSPTAADLQVCRDALARDIAVCIESLQFHDRLTQQLAQVRDILTGLAANRLLAKVPIKPSREGSIELF